MSSRRLAISSLLNQGGQQDDDARDGTPANAASASHHATGLDALVQAATSAPHMLPSISTFDGSQPQPKKRRHSDTQHEQPAALNAPQYREREPQRPMSTDAKRPNHYPDPRMLIDQYPRQPDQHARSPIFSRPVQERILSPSNDRMAQTAEPHRFALPPPIMPSTSRDFVSPKLSAREFARGEHDYRSHSRERSEQPRDRRDPSASREHAHQLPREHQFALPPMDRDHAIIGPRDHLSPTLPFTYLRDSQSPSTSRDPLREQLAREREHHGRTISPFVPLSEHRPPPTPRESPNSYSQFAQPLVGPGTSTQSQAGFRQLPSPFSREPPLPPTPAHESYHREPPSPFHREAPSSPFTREGHAPTQDPYSRDRYSREPTAFANHYPPSIERETSTRSQPSMVSGGSRSPSLGRDRSNSLSHSENVLPLHPLTPRDHHHHPPFPQTVQSPIREQYLTSPAGHRELRITAPDMPSFPPPRQLERRDESPRDVEARPRSIESLMNGTEYHIHGQDTKPPENQQRPVIQPLYAPNSRPRTSPIHSAPFAQELAHHQPGPRPSLSHSSSNRSLSSQSTTTSISPQTPSYSPSLADHRHEHYIHQSREERHDHKRKYQEEEEVLPPPAYHPRGSSVVERTQPRLAPLEHPEHFSREGLSPTHVRHHPASSSSPPPHSLSPHDESDTTLPDFHGPRSATILGGIKRTPPGSQQGRAHAHRKDKAVEMLDKEREKELKLEKEKEVKSERPAMVMPPTPVTAGSSPFAFGLEDILPLKEEDGLDMEVDMERKPVVTKSTETADVKQDAAAKPKPRKGKSKEINMGEPTSSAKPKKVTKKKEVNKPKEKEDAHDWFLEQFADSPGSSTSAPGPSRKSSKTKLRTATPVTDMDVDAELEETLLSRAPTPSVRGETPMDVDVDSELLNLIAPTTSSTPVPPPHTHTPTPPALPSIGGSLVPAGMSLAPPMRKAALKKLEKDKDRASMPPPPVVKKRTKPSAKTKKAPVEKGSAPEKKGKGKAVADRSRSTSAIPAEKEEEEEPDVVEEEEKVDDDRLYCLCRAKYNQEDTMVGCDRCDEWYHPHCVNMGETPLDLVDQFVCPVCVAKHPELNLKTTYKTRCLNGIEDPDRDNSCPRASRGLVSKYCSPECGVKNMRRRIDAFAAKGGNKATVWEKVKDAERRDGLVVHLGNGAVVKSRTKKDREVEWLQAQLEGVAKQRDAVKRGVDVVLWRERLLELAMDRAESKGNECGWDQRLCFGEEEWEEFGEAVLENYGTTEENYWCSEPADCDRHAGWQEIRQDDIGNEKEKQEEALMKLTTREREIRTQIEDLSEAPAPLKTNAKVVNGASSGPKGNGRTKHSKK